MEDKLRQATDDRETDRKYSLWTVRLISYAEQQTCRLTDVWHFTAAAAAAAAALLIDDVIDGSARASIEPHVTADLQNYVNVASSRRLCTIIDYGQRSQLAVTRAKYCFQRNNAN